MKKSLLLITIIFSILTAVAQEVQSGDGQAEAQQSPSITVDNVLQIQNNIYNRARRYGDNAMAVNAIYNILAIVPNNLPLYDSLALIYFQDRQYAKAVLVANDVIQASPEDQLALEIAGLSYDNLGLKAKALENYEELYLLNDDPFTLYKVSFLQYELGRYAECTTNINILLENDSTAEIDVYHAASNNQRQQVSMQASLFNLLGLVKMQMNDKEAARDNFEKALVINPEFELAKNNMEKL